MLRLTTSSLILAMLCAALLSCEATAEDVERWKGTQRGPAKITAVVIDNRYPMKLRAQAAVALVEIVRWDNFSLAFEQMSEDERRALIHEMVPRLRKMYSDGAAAAQNGIPTDEQVNAKDALVEIYSMASPEDQALIREPLLEWITSDFNGHYLQGRRNIAVVVEKVGAPAATALAGVLNTKNVLVLSRIAALVQEHGDEASKRVASKNLAKTGRDLGDRVRTDVFKAMAKICGEPIRQYALEYAAATKGHVESQANAIICVLGGGVPGCGEGCAQAADIEPLLAIAENEAQDERIRAAAYDALREHATASDAPRFLKLIDDPDARYRATGVDIAVHLGGAKMIVPVLERIGASDVEWPWMLKNRRTNNQEYGLCNMGLGQLEQVEGAREVLLAALDHDNAYVRGGAANMLGVLGTAEDVPRLEKLVSDRGRLKGWQPDKVGEQAQQAIERIRDSKRPADISARRGKACGLNVR